MKFCPDCNRELPPLTVKNGFTDCYPCRNRSKSRASIAASKALGRFVGSVAGQLVAKAVTRV